jgi:hypothetical protein
MTKMLPPQLRLGEGSRGGSYFRYAYVTQH